MHIYPFCVHVFSNRAERKPVNGTSPWPDHNYANREERKQRRHIPDRINSQPGADEENCKHGKQEVAEDLTLGVVGHLGSLDRGGEHQKIIVSTAGS